MARRHVFFFALMIICMASLLLHASARPMPTAELDPAAYSTAPAATAGGDQKTFLPCIPRVPKAATAAVAQSEQATSTFDVAPAPAGTATGLQDGKNFIYGGGVGVGVGGYAGFVGGFPVLGGIHYGGLGGAAGIGGLGGAAGGLLPCP